MSNATPAELPFEEFSQKVIASRDDVRDNPNVKNFGSIYKIKLEEIQVRNSFNPRRSHREIEELADSIDSNGLLTELVVDVLKSGEIFVERGHRRLHALQLLSERYKGEPFGLFKKRFEYIPCKVNNYEVTELQRTKNLYASNHFLGFTPIENSVTVARLKDVYGLTHEQIAKDLGMSRQSVDNYAKIAEMPDFVKVAIDDTQLSVNAALKVMRQFKDSQEQNDAFQEQMSNKNTSVNNASSSPKIPTAMQPIKDDVIAPDFIYESDNEDDDLKDGLSTDSDQVKLLQDTTGMLDKLTVKAAAIWATQPTAADDIGGLIATCIRNIETVRDYLKKTQK